MFVRALNNLAAVLEKAAAQDQRVEGNRQIYVLDAVLSSLCHLFR